MQTKVEHQLWQDIVINNCLQRWFPYYTNISHVTIPEQTTEWKVFVRFNATEKKTNESIIGGAYLRREQTITPGGPST